MNHMTNLFITKTFPDQHMYVSYCFATTDISITGKICTLYKSCALLFITEHSHKHVISFRFFLFFHWKWSASFQLNCDSHAVSFKLTTVWVSGFASHLLTFKSPLNHLLQLTFREKQTTAEYLSKTKVPVLDRLTLSYIYSKWWCSAHLSVVPILSPASLNDLCRPGNVSKRM